jgi:UrcA family protein
MNAISNNGRSNARVSLRAALLTAVLSGMAATPAVAGERASNDSPQAVVRYGDLDISTDAGALALYNRIADAARRVCPDDQGVRDLNRVRESRACRDAAVTRAVDALGSVKVASIMRAPKRRVG